MANIVLDTHACIFALAAPNKLGRSARAAIRRIEAGADQGWVPAAVVAEIILLAELGRTTIGLPQLKTVFDEHAGLTFLALDLAQLDVFSSLSAIRDPFDRLIISAARCLEAKLITKDEAIAASRLVRTVWT